ncbi:hypothetical protein CCMA1212_001348 [Trichoderma ghanense]|uniref:Uncharacterized protein n=1 Tax=Trichoderma ghanense TaxID=65468 RepID=A0ABY2HEZ9_9HYPO
MFEMCFLVGWPKRKPPAPAPRKQPARADQPTPGGGGYAYCLNLAVTGVVTGQPRSLTEAGQFRCGLPGGGRVPCSPGPLAAPDSHCWLRLVT